MYRIGNALHIHSTKGKKMAVKLSLCMIVKNEETVLKRCLASVGDLADEIVIVDTGSTDETKNIARSFTDAVYDYLWKDDFAAARNYSFSKATGDYLMWLDADDVIEGENKKLFKELKKILGKQRPDVVMCRYNIGFDENGAPAFTYYRERIFKKEGSFVWQGFVHECIPPRGNILYSEAAISHRKISPGNPRRNLELYQKAIFNAPLSTAREKYYYGRELYYNRLYKEAICILEDALLDPTLWRIDAAGACKLIAECHIYLRDYDHALTAAFRSFSFMLPTAENLCTVGNIFQLKKNYALAVYWYERALEAPPEEGGFVRPEFRDFIPALELSVCHYHLGNLEKAKAYHERARSLRPNHPSVLANERYFS